MTANRKRLPAGQIMKLFRLGLGIDLIASLYGEKNKAVESALRRQIARVCK